MTPTIQDIQKTQGTRLQEANPWETYAAEMGSGMNPELAAAVEEYAKHRYEDAKPSAQSQEVLHEQQEINQELAEQYNIVDRAEYEYIEPRIGKIMNHAEVINTLRKAGVQCFYRQHIHADKAVLWLVKNDKEFKGPWVQTNGPMPEYELMNFDQYGVATNTRRRGWRTVLLQLIISGFITEDAAHKYFGKAVGPSSSKYNSFLYELRKTRFEE